MAEVQVQAVLRFGRVVVLAAIVAATASLTILKDAITDPGVAALGFAVGTAALEFLAKLVGGATVPAPNTDAIGFTGEPIRARRPNILSI